MALIKRHYLYSLQFLVSVVILWKYNLKFLNPAWDAISQMSRTFVVLGVEQNPAFVEASTMVPLFYLLLYYFIYWPKMTFQTLLKNLMILLHTQSLFSLYL